MKNEEGGRIWMWTYRRRWWGGEGISKGRFERLKAH
jgi:hypothetical protein